MSPQNKPRLLAVVMAGGQGTRFWPRSRRLRPKQFLAMAGSDSMLHQTVARLFPRFAPEDVYILTTTDLAEETRRLLPMLPPENVLTEPEGRNTAPCLALALVQLEQQHPDAVMVVLSADHWIGDHDAFIADLERAGRHAAEHGDLVTFGIRPAHPDTGFGYIETEGDGPVLRAAAFREKPPLETAMAYVATGRHYWNAGMFVWTLKNLRQEFLANSPETLQPLDAWVAGGAKPEALPAAYGLLPKLSIDYAIMEKSKHVAVVPASFRWSDVGLWPAVAEFHEPDAEGNVTQGDVVLLDSSRCAVFGGNRLIAALGVEDLIIVDEKDALLICPKSKAQDVKRVVDRLKALGREELL